MHLLTDILINAEVLLSKDDSTALYQVFVGLSTLVGRSLVSGTQIIFSIPWSMSVNLMMGLSKSKNSLQILLPPTFMRRATPMATLL